jgi:hypothetical protein
VTYHSISNYCTFTITILPGISLLITKTASFYTRLAGSRHCETIFIGSTPDGLPSIPKMAPFVACFCNTSPQPNPSPL